MSGTLEHIKAFLQDSANSWLADSLKVEIDQFLELKAVTAESTAVEVSTSPRHYRGPSMNDKQIKALEAFLDTFDADDERGPKEEELIAAATRLLIEARTNREWADVRTSGTLEQIKQFLRDSKNSWFAVRAKDEVARFLEIKQIINDEIPADTESKVAGLESIYTKFVDNTGAIKLKMALSKYSPILAILLIPILALISLIFTVIFYH